MAKTLAAFKKEFEDLKKLVASDADEMQSLDHNLDQHREIMGEGFKALGVRIHELRDTGMPGTRIEDFMRDQEAATMVRELTARRDTAKKDALHAQTVHNTKFKPLLARMNALIEGLNQEIADRKKKFSSKTLGINQSVKEMEPLLAEVTSYTRGGNADYSYIHDYNGGYPPAQFDRLYTTLLTEELNKSRAEALSAQEQMLLKQQLNDKVIKMNIAKARAALAEVTRQAKLGQDAQKTHNAQALATAQKATAAANIKITAVLTPYEKAEKDAKLMDVLRHSPDGQDVLKGLTSLKQMKTQAEQAVKATSGLRVA